MVRAELRALPVRDGRRGRSLPHPQGLRPHRRRTRPLPGGHHPHRTRTPDRAPRRRHRERRSIVIPVLISPALPNAACADSATPDDWHPGERDRHEAAEAKAVCAGCEERVACLKWALDNDERFGIWGALDETERRKLRRNQARKSRAKEAS